jgi:8-oxo-dGTP pyrophosphatase MutT (NUDIX family)
MIKKWSVTKSQQVESNRVFSVRKDTSISPYNGNKHDFFIIEAPDWINVVALTQNDEVVLIEQYRHGSGEVTIEIPGGMIDPGESPIDTAKRELLEETGYAGDSWVKIGEVLPNPAIQSNRCFTYLARNCKKVSETNFDSTEYIVTYTKPYEEIPKLLSEGKITHSLVVAAFYWYYLYKQSES